MMCQDQIFGNYYNPTFADVFPSAEVFTAEYQASGLYDPDNTVKKIDLLFYLLYSRYGNSVVASMDINRFKYNLYSIIFMYGPAWETRLSLQKELRDLANSDELFEGSTMINNHSYNPSNTPSNDTFEALPTINDQTANRRKKPKIEGYASVLGLLKSDVSAEFLDRFKVLFLTIVEPNAPLWYNTTPEEQEILEI